MKNVLVTGAKGQLGQTILNADPGYPLCITGIDKEELDLTLTTDVQQYFSSHNFDYVINCAAYTQVDAAEQNAAAAYRVNAELPALLAEMSSKMGFRIIHISTDYVFDGTSSVPYTETSVPNPISVYGRSKLEGEKYLLQHDKAMIIRSSWLYSAYGNNFARTMIRLGRERESLGVIFDQTGSPTWATDLARTILEIIRIAEQGNFQPGVFHFSNEGVCSWFDFAWEIMHEAGLSCHVIPIRTEDYPLPAKRPAYSVLDKTKIRKHVGFEIPYWKDSLKIALKSF